MSHISTADLEAVRRGSLSASEAAAIGSHVATCARCAALMDEALSIEQSAASLDAALELELEEELPPVAQPAPALPRRRRLALRWGAAAAAAAAAIFVVLQLPSDRTPAPPPGRRVTVAPKTKSVPPPASVKRPMPQAWRALVDEVRRTKTLPFPADLRELAAEDELRGGPSEAADARVWPAATAVEELRPRFTWPAPADARSTVTLRRAADGRVVERGTRLTKPRWQPAALLERGVMYVWQVHVVRKGESLFLPAPPAPPAMFRVIDDHEHEQLQAARREFPDDHLLLALLYARAGIVDAARRELERYASASRDPLAAVLTAQLPSSPRR